MATMGKYCKAYLVNDLREYTRRHENVRYMRQEKREEEGEEMVV